MDLTLGHIYNLLRRAVDRGAKRARQLGRNTGTPAYVPEDSEIVDPTERCRHKNRRGQLQDEAEGDLATDRKKTSTPTWPN